MPFRIYTRTGDSGETDLYHGGRARKDSLRIECLGALDELNAHLGLARQNVSDEAIGAHLLTIQKRLFDLAAEVATPDKAPARGKKRESKDSPPNAKTKASPPAYAVIADSDIAESERLMDEYISRMDQVSAFIVPGTSPAAAQLHVARTVCRRAERRLISLGRKEALRPELLRYINRLSDLLYIFARYCEDEIIYIHPKQ
ncbi:MAG: cob(I)yrinic acid a,c-diamide adenosyltransferase [Candidatus Sumerlaeota bacterium]|nr:cob(I)yrinic acid a,c-diamide adenosyltransferase [Candidatus Sumerlaeota bacterium]